MCLATMFRIGPAKAADIANIERLCDEHYDALARYDLASMQRAASSRQDDTYTDRGIVEARVVSWGAEVCAAARWHMCAGRAADPHSAAARIECLSVSRPYQGTGLGRRLVADIAGRASARGATQLTVVAPVDAMPFLQKLGFRPKHLAEVSLSQCQKRPVRGLGTLMVLSL